MPVQAQQTTTATSGTDNTHTITSSEESTMRAAAAAANEGDATTKTTPPELTHELVTEILQYKAIYTDPEEEEVCRVREFIVCFIV